jgi:alpha-mannosidase
MLTYDHGGIILWGPDHFKHALRNAMTWLDRYPEFKIGLDNEAYVYDYIAEHDPSLLEELRADLAKRRNRFGIGTCTYGQPLSTFIDDESNIRQIGYAIKTDERQLGYTPVIYLMSEHAMHSQIPQILDGFGFKGAIMRTHFMMYGFNPTFDVPIGWWTGLDGSRIAAIPTYPGEGGEFFKTTVDDWILTRYPSEAAKLSLDDFRRKFANLNPLLASRADDSSLRREELVKQYPGGGGFQWILLDEMLSKYPVPTEEMRTLPDDFTVRMPWGYCGNVIWNLDRQAEVAVQTAERLAAIELLKGGKGHQTELECAWKSLLVGQHHDIQICGLLFDAHKFASASLAASNNVIQASLRFAADHMRGDGEAQVTAFNPLAWTRKEWIEAEMVLPKASASGVVVTHHGIKVPSVVLKSERGGGGLDTRLSFLAEIPPLSLASYSVVLDSTPAELPADKVEVDQEKLLIRTPFLKARLDPNGGLSSLVDRRTNSPIFAPGQRSGYFAGRINNRDCESKGSWVIHAASASRPWATAREYGFIGGIPYVNELIFRADSPRIDCHVSFHFEGERIGHVTNDVRDTTSAFIHEEKLRFKVFPAQSARDTVGVRDLPFAVAETSSRYVEGLHWSAITDRHSGIAFFNRGTMGAVREADNGFSLSLAYAMNYIWGIRMLTGDFAYDFAIEPFSGDWRAAGIHRMALEYAFPVVSTCGSNGSGEFGDIVQPMGIDGNGISLSALYPENGHAFLRLFNFTGSTEVASITLGGLGGAFKATDLLGRGDGPPEKKVSLRPWQFQTFRIEQ